MTDQGRSGLRYALVLVLLLLVSCQEQPELASEFPNHTLLAMGALGTDVRLSFSGPDLAVSQLIGEEARADETLFILLEPRALRAASASGSLDNEVDDGAVPLCTKACAQVLKFADQGIWVKGETCKKGPVAAFSTLDVPTGDANQARIYQATKFSFPGQIELPEQVVCYETYFYHEGEVVCEQSCLKCGAGEFDCVFYSPALGFLLTEMPEDAPSSVSEIDCNDSDLTQCGGGLP